MKRMSLLSGLVLALMAQPAMAASITLTDNGQFTVNWLNTATNPDLSGSAHFVVTNFSNTGFDLRIDQVANTTAPLPDINARLVSFGFGLTPNYATVTSQVDSAEFAWGFTNFPSFGQVDICAFAGNNCAGGGNAGLHPGESMASGDFMSIRFNGDFTGGVTFYPIAARFQTSVGSFTFDGYLPPDDTTPLVPTPVPSPRPSCSSARG